MKGLKKTIDFIQLRSSLEKLDLVISVDCNHGAAAIYLPEILKDLGLQGSDNSVAYFLNNEQRKNKIKYFFTLFFCMIRVY
jgi:phosphomannomutase